MKTENIENAYEIIKNYTRDTEGSFGKDNYIDLVNSLEISSENKDRLLRLTPTSYF